MTRKLPARKKATQALRLLQTAILAMAGWWAFAPALTGGWVWDDATTLPGNALLHDPARLWKTWFAPGTFDTYYPLTATAQFVQWLLWGNEPLFYHVTNVVLHILNALLVWRLFNKVGLRLAWLGGLIFAVHPLTVESVAWISELKNTLSLAPFLLAMILYLDYEEEGRERDYGLAMGLFLAAMLAKVTMAPFPAVILLHAWWKRGRIGWGDLRAAAPFLVISLTLVAMTVLAGMWHQRLHPGAEGAVAPGNWLVGLASAGLMIFFFAVKFIWPVGLTLIYPQFFKDGVTPPDFFPWIAVAAIVGWLGWKRRKRWSRDTLLGLGFYLVMLTPVLGFIVMHVTDMKWSLDHLVYLPMIGLTGLTVAGLETISARLSPRLRCAGIGVLAVALTLLIWQSHATSGTFQNEETVWRSTLKLNPGSWEAHDRLGNVLAVKGRFPEAMAEYGEALRLNPNSADPHSNMALILSQNGHGAEALAEYAEALKISPKSAAVRYNLADTLIQTGRVAEAIAQYKMALEIDPGMEEAHYNLGNALIQTGHVPEAASEYEAALRLNPDHGDAHTNLGNALLHLDRREEALHEYGEALRINPNDVDVHNNLGLVLIQLGRLPEARAQFETVLRLDPHNAPAQVGLSRTEPSHPSPP